jgi:hypothetical protein
MHQRPSGQFHRTPSRRVASSGWRYRRLFRSRSAPSRGRFTPLRTPSRSRVEREAASFQRVLRAQHELMVEENAGMAMTRAGRDIASRVSTHRLSPGRIDNQDVQERAPDDRPPLQGRSSSVQPFSRLVKHLRRFPTELIENNFHIPAMPSVRIRRSVDKRLSREVLKDRHLVRWQRSDWAGDSKRRYGRTNEGRR